MKGIKKTLFAGFLACSALQAQAVDNPWGFGVQGGYAGTMARVDKKEVKVQGNPSQNPLNHWGSGGLYGKYTFGDYVGLRLGAHYARQNNSLKEEGKDKTALAIKSDGITVPFSFSVYPFGYEIEEGVWSINLGGNVFFPLSTTLEKDGSAIDKNSLTNEQKQGLPGWDWGGHLALAYEFPFGLNVEGLYQMEFGNRIPNALKPIFGNVTGLKAKDLQENRVSVNVGYNFASLFTA
jgi:hypothetical protein